jgi:hypothetical protein
VLIAGIARGASKASAPGVGERINRLGSARSWLNLESVCGVCLDDLRSAWS